MSKDAYTIIIPRSPFIGLIKPPSARELWKFNYRKMRLKAKGIIEPDFKGEISTFKGIFVRHVR